MEKTFVTDKIIEKIDFAQTQLDYGEYENCKFVHCNFSNISLTGFNFIECEFINCNLSLANINKTSFRDIKFKDCKLLGLHFNDCNPFMFTANFENCLLNLSSFHKLKMKAVKFISCSLQEVDFSEADLNGAIFDKCDLLNTLFENTILEKADFRTSYNYTLNPEINKLKKAKFAQEGLAGLLGKYDIIIE